jgi:LPS-assembly protein
VQRSETRLNVVLPRLYFAASHLKDVLDVDGRTREDLDFYARANITRRFGVSAYAVRDQAAGVWRRQDLGVFYEDDCLLLEVVYEREETFNRTLGPSEGVRVRLRLATFGQGLTTDDRFDRQR